MDSIRSAWGIKFPYSVERIEADPEEDPVMTMKADERAAREAGDRARREAAAKEKAKTDKS